MAASVIGKQRCSVCGHRVWSYQELPEYFIENARKHGFPYGEENVETCNYRNYSCPFCGASDRDRLSALYVHSYLSAVGRDRRFDILDIAPTPALSGMIRRKIVFPGSKLTYRTADLISDSVDDRIDITDMNIYKDNQFDFVLCSHVLEHVTDDKMALKELRRILKPGCRGLLMVPIILSIKDTDEDPTVTDEAERWRRFGQNDHVRLYSKEGFVRRVADAGFKLYQYSREYFGEQLFDQNAIAERSVLYIVEK